MRYWLEDYGWLFVAIFVCAGLFGVCVYYQEQEIDTECGVMASMARTSRDSLDARIACNKMHSDAATATAISVGSGAVAGAAASRR